MLALVVLSTAIIGAAAAQAGAWRVLAGSRRDVNEWAALHRQAEELIAAGYDNVSSGARVVNGYPLQWAVGGVNPKLVVLVARRQVGTEVLADTIQIILRKPDP